MRRKSATQAGSVSDTPAQITERIHRMPDPELLRFGESCRLMCSSEANFDKTPLESWLLQLQLVRDEWGRRHPTLPFSEALKITPTM